MTISRAWMMGLTVATMTLLGAGLQSPRATATQQAGVDAHATTGTGVVEEKSEKQGTVTIGGQVYGVVPATRIVDKNGELIPLKKLPVARVFRDEPMVDTAAIVSFEATETGHGWVLDYVRVQGQLPQ